MVAPAAPHPGDEVESDIEVELGTPNGNKPATLSAQHIAAQRAELARRLKNDYPGQWGVVSRGHISRGSARQVRDRIKGRVEWHDFEWAVCQHPDDPKLHRILARWPDGTEYRPPELPAELVDPVTAPPTLTF